MEALWVRGDIQYQKFHHYTVVSLAIPASRAEQKLLGILVQKARRV